MSALIAFLPRRHCVTRAKVEAIANRVSVFVFRVHADQGAGHFGAVFAAFTLALAFIMFALSFSFQTTTVVTFLTFVICGLNLFIQLLDTPDLFLVIFALRLFPFGLGLVGLSGLGPAFGAAMWARGLQIRMVVTS